MLVDCGESAPGIPDNAVPSGPGRLVTGTRCLYIPKSVTSTYKEKLLLKLSISSINTVVVNKFPEIDLCFHNIFLPPFILNFMFMYFFYFEPSLLYLRYEEKLLSEWGILHNSRDFRYVFP